MKKSNEGRNLAKALFSVVALAATVTIIIQNPGKSLLIGLSALAVKGIVDEENEEAAAHQQAANVRNDETSATTAETKEDPVASSTEASEPDFFVEGHTV